MPGFEARQTSEPLDSHLCSFKDWRFCSISQARSHRVYLRVYFPYDDRNEKPVIFEFLDSTGKRLQRGGAR